MNALEVNDLIDDHISVSRKMFHDELSSDENKDYRRGYRAGVLFAFLQIKSDIGNMTDASIERSAGEGV